MFAAACAAGASALAVVFGVTNPRAVLLVAASAASGGLIRRLLGRSGIGIVAQAFAAATVAGVAGALAIRLNLGPAAQLVALCPAMVLVPGPHILNGALDLLGLRLTLGIARLGFAALVLTAIALGLIAGLGMGGQTLAVSAGRRTRSAVCRCHRRGYRGRVIPCLFLDALPDDRLAGDRRDDRSCGALVGADRVEARPRRRRFHVVPAGRCHPGPCRAHAENPFRCSKDSRRSSQLLPGAYVFRTPQRSDAADPLALTGIASGGSVPTGPSPPWWCWAWRSGSSCRCTFSPRSSPRRSAERLASAMSEAAVPAFRKLDAVARSSPAPSTTGPPVPVPRATRYRVVLAGQAKRVVAAHELVFPGAAHSASPSSSSYCANVRASSAGISRPALRFSTAFWIERATRKMTVVG